MKERPILFSAPMVRAILDGRKTQTRRVDWSARQCPYGAPGDRLWVREEHYVRGHWESVPGVRTKTGRMKWRFVAADDVVRFDAPAEYRKGRHHKDPGTVAWHKRLARFMPRKASRITLEVTHVRVSRLLNITCGDAVAEGIESVPPAPGDFEAWRDYGATCDHGVRSPIRSFASLWNSINGAGSWAANPWVWVVNFKRVTP